MNYIIVQKIFGNRMFFLNFASYSKVFLQVQKLSPIDDEEKNEYDVFRHWSPKETIAVYDFFVIGDCWLI